ncbi:MAG: conjugal transfer protein TraG N-terminal domain-containing protein, partial [Thermoprotei archaeon]
MNFEIFVYNDFESMVGVLKGIAYIFNNNIYLAYYGVALIIAIIIYGINLYVEKLSGGKISQGTIVKNILMGILMYHILVVPKCTIAVYDKIRNRNEVVSNIPIVIGLFGGISNKVAYEIGEIIETGIGPVGGGIADIGYGQGFKMLKNLAFIKDFVTSNQNYLTSSINNYLQQCVSLAISDLTITPQSLTADGSKSLWEKLSTPYTSIVTTVYDSDGNPLVKSCKDAYTYINLNRQLDITNTNPVIKKYCALNSYDMSNNVEVNKCIDTLKRMFSSFLELDDSTYSKFLANIIVSNVFKDYTIENSGQSASAILQSDIQTNSQAQGIGFKSADMAERILPTLHSTMWAILIAIAPIVMVFILVAPQNVFKWYIGMFLWLLFWQLIDVTANSILQSKAYNILSVIRSTNGNGLMDNLMLPNLSMEILSMYSNVRWMSASFSAALVYGIIQVGGYALSSIAGSIGSAFQSTASHVGQAMGTAKETMGAYAYQRASMGQFSSMMMNNPLASEIATGAGIRSYWNEANLTTISNNMGTSVSEVAKAFGHGGYLNDGRNIFTPRGYTGIGEYRVASQGGEIFVSGDGTFSRQQNAPISLAAMSKDFGLGFNNLKANVGGFSKIFDESSQIIGAISVTKDGEMMIHNAQIIDKEGVMNA